MEPEYEAATPVRVRSPLIDFSNQPAQEPATPVQVVCTVTPAAGGSGASSRSSGSSSEKRTRISLTFTTPRAKLRTGQHHTGQPSCSEAACAICLSPLNTVRGASSGTADPRGEIRETFVTPCNHWFHKCCIQSCRASDIAACPLCRHPLPAGLTPPLVKAQREEAAATTAAATHMRDLMIRRAGQAREAVRAAYQRGLDQHAARDAEQRHASIVGSNEMVAEQQAVAVQQINRATSSPFQSALEVVVLEDTEVTISTTITTTIMGGHTEQEGSDNAILQVELQNNGNNEGNNDGPDIVSDELKACYHCQKLCEAAGQCSQCDESFCRLCSTINYDLREDRLFCLTCIFDEISHGGRTRVISFDAPQQALVENY